MNTMTTPKRQTAAFHTERSATMFAISQRERGARDVTTSYEATAGEWLVQWTEYTTD